MSWDVSRIGAEFATLDVKHAALRSQLGVRPDGDLWSSWIGEAERRSGNRWRAVAADLRQAARARTPRPLLRAAVTAVSPSAWIDLHNRRTARASTPRGGTRRNDGWRRSAPFRAPRLGRDSTRETFAVRVLITPEWYPDASRPVFRRLLPGTGSRDGALARRRGAHLDVRLRSTRAVPHRAGAPRTASGRSVSAFAARGSRSRRARPSSPGSRRSSSGCAHGSGGRT